MAARMLIAAVLCGWTTAALAGGGPEGVLLVVNPQSPSSLTIANHYIQLREIPPENVIYIPWEPGLQTTDIATFRQQILRPLIETIDRRRLSEQIDYVVYSSDFPWGIALDRDVRKFMEDMQRSRESSNSYTDEASNSGKGPAVSSWPTYLTPVGSLTGLTYLWQPTALVDPAYFDAQSNRYARRSAAASDGETSAGFRGNRLYDPEGKVVAAHGWRYFLSTMLGVTAGRGNSLDEVLQYLERSAKADATHPKGTIYFARNADIRSKTRDELFPNAVENLTKLGVAATIVEGAMPLKKDDVQGVVMGASDFDWKASGSTILPGAICDNFTSFGGVMSFGSSQTPLADFLRYGAAGASGTVAEPYAIAAKFPSVMTQVHYARGCSLAEAFYQSVQSPYQLLIVGDPLCRPWANVPKVSVTGVEPGAVVQGTLKLKPAATLAGNKPVEDFNLYVDGLQVATCKPDGTLLLDTTPLSDGYHELRVVAVGPAPIESQGRQIIPVRLNNYGRTVEALPVNQGRLRANMPLAIAARSPRAIGMIALEGTRVVGRVAGQQGVINIPPKTLGAGPVLLRIVSLGEGDARTNAISQPLRFVLE